MGEGGWNRILLGAALMLFALKLILMLASPVTQDEAYYFLWSLNLSLSYFDHPPLSAWVLWPSVQIFGWTTIGVRAPVILSSLATIWMLYLWARRRGGDAWLQQFLISAILFLSLPVILAANSAALPDHLLLLFGIASAHFFLAFFEEYEAGKTATRFLYLGAVLLGLAALSKYNAVFLGLGVAALVIFSARLRPLLGNPHLWLAALLALAIQAPVVVWNLTENFASYGFVLSGRHGLMQSRADFAALLPSILTTIFILSPLLLPAFWRLVFSGDTAPARRLALFVFLLSSAVMLPLSLFTLVLFHWNLAAYLLLVPLFAAWIGPRLALAQAAYGVIFLIAAIVNFAFVPLTAIFSVPDRFSAHSYGWAEVAEAARPQFAESNVDFYAGTSYPLASQLAFAQRDPSVTSLYPGMDQFDFWFDTEAHRGQSAIVIADRFNSFSERYAERFDKVTELEPVEITRFGYRVNTIRIFFAEGFRP